eukprot:GHVR01121407.1.p1 GENE.GHVR01121407.1~~GHVR01121407.1.p1  ORF type:complete len:286 (-),score=35.97 GHVR01121407.1:92-949(-)
MELSILNKLTKNDIPFFSDYIYSYPCPNLLTIDGIVIDNDSWSTSKEVKKKEKKEKEDGCTCIIMRFGGKGILNVGVYRANSNDRFKWLLQSITFLYYMKNMHYIHGDIKGANILLDDNGNVMFADFGLTQDAKNGCTKFHGTPGFMAPEVCTASKEYSGVAVPHGHKSDIYALGVTFFILCQHKLGDLRLKMTYPYTIIGRKKEYKNDFAKLLDQNQKIGPFAAKECDGWTTKSGKPIDSTKLISTMLERNARDRKTAGEMLTMLGWTAHEVTCKYTGKRCNKV